MLDQTTKHKIDSARQILVGKVPDPKAQVEQITTALIYKFMDDMDKESEEFGGKTRFFTDGFSQYSWSKLLDKKLSGQARLDLYVQAITNIPKNPHIPQLFRDIFKGAFLPFRDPRTLTLFLKQINEFSYDNSENLGNAFEYLLSILGSQGDAGQFRTPRHIIDFIIEVVDPKKNDTILDPACGTAGFLISAYKHILQEHDGIDNTTGKPANKEKLLTPDEKTKMMSNFVGYDISPDMVKLSLVNLYLHGFPEPKIEEYDTLSSEKRWDETFDVIFANPPFMTPKGGIQPHKRFSIQAKRAEVLFVDYIAEHLNINGRAGIIVPEGIIFQSSNAYKNLRKKLIENWGLFAVVSLPAGIFQPYSGVKTSILFLDKELSKTTDKILFAKVENDGFDLGAQRRKNEKNDLPNALEILKTWRKLQKVKKNTAIAQTVVKDKIAESGDYSLSGDRYRETIDYGEVQWEMVNFEEVCTLEYGKSLPKRERLPGKYPVMGSNGRCGFHNDYLINGPAIIVGRKGSAGKVNWEESNCFPIDTTYYVKLKHPKETDLKYIYSMLKSLNLSSVKNGAGIPGLNRNDVYNKYRIPLPPIKIQKQIVDELNVYQKIIEGAKQVVKNWKPSIKIDPTWDLMKLVDITKFIDYRGKTPTKTKSGIPLITAKNVKFGYLQDEPREFISVEDFDTWMTRGIPSKGDVLFTTEAPLGNVCQINTDKKIALAQRLITFVPDRSILIDTFLKIIMLTDFMQNKIQAHRTGSTVFGIKAKTLKSITVPVPSLEIQNQIVDDIEVEQKTINANKKLIQIFQQKIEDRIDEVWGKG